MPADQLVVSGFGCGLVLAGVCGGVGAVFDAEFGDDGADVVADGFGADVQPGGDVGIAAPSGQQLEYLAFPAGRSVRAGRQERRSERCGAFGRAAPLAIADCTAVMSPPSWAMAAS
jgi:hypothetical protein